jgi:hypothetical protein
MFAVMQEDRSMYNVKVMQYGMPCHWQGLQPQYKYTVLHNWGDALVVH